MGLKCVIRVRHVLPGSALPAREGGSIRVVAECVAARLGSPREVSEIAQKYHRYMDMSPDTYSSFAQLLHVFGQNLLFWVTSQ